MNGGHTALPPAVVVHISGNIGASKSTVLADIQKNKSCLCGADKYSKVVIVQENVKAWAGALANYYQWVDRDTAPRDRSNSALALQMAIAEHYLDVDATVAKMRESGEVGPILVLVERSAEESNEVFVPMLEEQGILIQEHAALYRRFWARQGSRGGGRDEAPRHMILLHATPDECLARIRRRNRPGESDINLPYLQNLDSRYATLANVRKHTVDAAQKRPAVVNDVMLALLGILEDREAL